MIDNGIHLVMISDLLIESSSTVWMIDNDTHQVVISDLLLESSAPVWMIDNDINLVMISDSLIESSSPVSFTHNDIHLVMISDYRPGKTSWLTTTAGQCSSESTGLPQSVVYRIIWSSVND